MSTSAFFDEVLGRWNGWLERVNDELLVLHMNRDVWRKTIEMMQGNSAVRDTGGFFADWITRLYVDAQVMRIRRQAEDSKGVVSLGRLMGAIHKQPEVLNRERHIALYLEKYPDDPVMEMAATSEFESLWGKDAPHAVPERVAADLEKLQSVVGPVKEFANKNVAHLDHAPVGQIPSFDQLDQAVNTLGVLFERYHLAVTGIRQGATRPSSIIGWRRSEWPGYPKILDSSTDAHSRLVHKSLRFRSTGARKASSSRSVNRTNPDTV
jgi:hypothetical protein